MALTNGPPAPYDPAGTSLGHGRGPSGFTGHSRTFKSIREPRAGLAVSNQPKEASMPDDFEYVSQSRVEYRHGYRHAYLGEVPAPVVYGVQGKLREYYGVAEGPPVASTLDHIVAAVAG